MINHDSDAYIKSLEEWIPIPGSIEAIAQLSKAGWTVAVATNQSGIARGYYPLATLEAMHARLRALVAEQGARWVTSCIARTARTTVAIAANPSLACCGRLPSIIRSIWLASGLSATAKVTWRPPWPSMHNLCW